jgi:hypothetical protein
MLTKAWPFSSGATMTDLLFEPRISLTELAKREDVNVTTCWRWANRGVKGVRLETISVGGRRFTTIPAFARFVERTTRAANRDLPLPSTRRQREREIAQAEKILVEAGI